MPKRSSLPARKQSRDDGKRSREELIDELKSLRREYVNLKILEYEHEKAQAALKEGEERYRRIVETASDIIYRTNDKGFFTYANAAAVRIIGYPLKEIIGRNYLELIHPDYRKKAFRHYSDQVARRIRSTYFEFPAITKKGKEVWLGQNAQMIFQGKRFVEMQAVARDITDVKLAEEERERLEGQLRQAQKMESVGRLAGGISHDFNNILGIILAYTNILEYEHLPRSQVVASLDAIKKTVTRARGVIRELLTLAQKTVPSAEHVDVNDSIREFTGLIKETFPRSVAIDLKLDEHVRGIEADPNQFHQLLLNLYVNARDAMDKAGALTVQTSTVRGPTLARKFKEAGKGSYTRISIRDTGVGMNEQTRSRIFEPFFSTKGHGKGSGLGLAVAYGIVQSHQGFIDVESSVGKGSTFHLYFPAKEGMAAPRKAAMPVREIEGGSETILVVEDEHLLRDALVQILRDKGYRVIMAADGIEAVEVFMKYHTEISLVVADLGLPRLGGWDSCVAMREINPNVKMILTSGFIEPAVKSEMNQYGVQAFVQKPYELVDILHSIRDILKLPASS